MNPIITGEAIYESDGVTEYGYVISLNFGDVYNVFDNVRYNNSRFLLRTEGTSRRPLNLTLYRNGLPVYYSKKIDDYNERKDYYDSIFWGACAKK